MTTKSHKSEQSYHHHDLASDLLQWAEVELSEKGVEKFSLRAVAKRAGVSHGAPAHHFKNVTGLLTALAAAGYEKLLAVQAERQARSKVDPKSQVVASGLGYIQFARENQALFRLMFSSAKPNRSDAVFAEASMATFNKLVTDIKNVLKADPYTNPVAMKQVMASWSMAHGLAELIISGRAEIPLGFGKMTTDDQEAAITEIILKVLKLG